MKEFGERRVPKHRYIQILGKNKSEKRKLSKMLKHKTSPYPKDRRVFTTD